MGDLTDNFDRKEFACSCGCGFDTVDHELLQALQAYADSLKVGGNRVSIIVNSGCRCPARNEREGGKPNSQHLKGRAADIQVFSNGRKLQPADVAHWFETYYKHFGIGIYPSFIHLDSRSGGPARW
jgi:uncharacterized protein YcbK (DUF882 family)